MPCVLLGWGNAAEGQLGPTGCDVSSRPKVLPLEQPSAFAAGIWSSVVVASGGRAVYVTSSPSSDDGVVNAPFELVPGTAEGNGGELPPISAAAAGRDFVVLLAAGGGVYAMGDGAYGQLGHGRVASLTRPSLVPGLRGVRVVAVAAAEFHWLALDGMGRVFCCGKNSQGELGVPFRGKIDSPRVVEALWPHPVVAIATGDLHSAALTAGGGLLMFGSNKYGQLGQASFGVQVCSLMPVPVPLPGGVGADDEGDVDMMDVAMDASADLLRVEEEESVAREVPGYADVACGSSHTVALLSDGRLVTWGKGDNGQLGTRGTGTVYAPTVVGSSGRFVGVSAGDLHSAALTADGTAYLWGDGSLGQIGDGDVSSKFVPVPVPSPRVGKSQIGVSEDMREREGNGKRKRSEGKNENVSLRFLQLACGGHHTLGLATDDPSMAVSGARHVYRNRIAKCVIDGMPQSKVGISRFGSAAVLLRTFVRPKLKPLAKGKVDVDAALMAYAAFLRLFGGDGKMVLGYAAARIRHEAQIAFGLVKSEGGVHAYGAESYLDEGEKPRLVTHKTKFLNDENLFQSSVANCYECGYLFLLALLNPIYGERGRISELAELASVLLRCEENAREAFLEMVSYCSEQLIVTHFIRPFQTLLTEDLKSYGRVRRNAKLATKALALCYHAVWRASKRKRIRGLIVPRKEFYNETVSERMDLREDYDRWSESHGDDAELDLSELPPLPTASQEEGLFSFCAHSFLLSESAKFQILEMESHRTMSKERVRSVLSFGSLPMTLGPWGRFTNIRIPVEQIAQLQYLVLSVRRDNIVSDAFVQVAEYAERHPRELLKPLKVIFDGEDGVDEGGVQKEFYQVLLENVLSPDYGMFVYDEETRFHWFRRDSLENENSWSLIGIMFGLAAFNSILLDVQFPPVLYRKLQVALRSNLNESPNDGDEGVREVYKADLDDVKETFPSIGNSLEHLLSYKGNDVEDVFSLTFEISYKGLFGKVKSVELLPGGADKPVTNANRAQFASLYIDYLINTSIEHAFTQFARGFSFMLRGPFVHMFSADELETLLVGEKELDFVSLKKTTKYEGYTENSPVIDHLWQVLMEYDESMKRLFLSFVTGTDRAPIGGLQKLQLIIQRAEGDSNRLPTSHTCFNVLLLPEYGTRAKLRDRLSTAIRNSKGFGLR